MHSGGVVFSIPRSLVPHEIHEGEILPVYLDRRAVPWLRETIELFDALVGAPRRELDDRLHHQLAPSPPSAALRRVALHFLLQLYKSRT